MDRSQVVEAMVIACREVLQGKLRALDMEVTEAWRGDDISLRDMHRLQEWLADIAVAIQQGPNDKLVAEYARERIEERAAAIADTKGGIS